MRATNLKFETRYSKLATNLKFGIQICLASKLFLCACASGNNANPNLVAKLLPYAACVVAVGFACGLLVFMVMMGFACGQKHGI